MNPIFNIFKSLYKNEFLILAIASRTKYFETFTTWNWLLIILKRYYNLSYTSLLVNSITTWIGFQYAGTDGGKNRLMEKKKLSSVPLFFFYESIAHLSPVLVLGYIVISNKMKIHLKDILRSMSWLIFYFIIVVRGFYAEKQYVKYPYYRKVFQVFTTPLITMNVINSYINNNHKPLVAYLIYLWYGKDYFDICDYKKKLKI